MGAIIESDCALQSNISARTSIQCARFVGHLGGGKSWVRYLSYATQGCWSIHIPHTAGISQLIPVGESIGIGICHAVLLIPRIISYSLQIQSKLVIIVCGMFASTTPWGSIQVYVSNSSTKSNTYKSRNQSSIATLLHTCSRRTWDVKSIRNISSMYSMGSRVRYQA